MAMIVVCLLSAFAIVASQPYEKDSPACTIIKNVYEATCMNPVMTTASTTSTTKATTPPGPTCLVTYEEKCFWIESQNEAEVTYDVGKGMCEASGGDPANIYSKAHYDMVLEKMRDIAKASDGQYYVWLGMRYDPVASSNAVLYNGTAAPYTRWHSGYPNGQYGKSQITLVAKAGSGSEHMHNWKSSSGDGTRRGILCEI